MSTILIILIVLLVAGFFYGHGPGNWGPNTNWIGLVVLILIILLITGRI